MTLYSSDVDQAATVCNFTSSGEIALVKTGVTLISEQSSCIVSDGEDTETIYNYGGIVGLYDGISLIEGTTGGNEVFNYGVIDGGAKGNAGVNDGDANSRIVNDGQINGYDFGVELGGTSSSLINTGTITCSSAVDSPAINDGVRTTGNTDVITNRGDIQGSVFCGGTSATVSNAGTILGNVVFSSGTNAYDGRGGTIDGIITGGSGSDTIRTGSDGETIIGGKGFDYLYAGTGADTFVLNSTNTLDRDRIHGFDVAHDTVELTQKAFTTLALDTAPTFAIGTAAASSTDHLFYNSSTGYLFYDKDGSGTHYAAVEIAHLDPGLKLTAADFLVV